ncbi:MAG: glycoside hydrolase family 3 C-terminal domain-containing protein [Propionibacteriaceae bacterium]|jgi:beta-glucosidase|nr:glycoside hydrolase family 3 C-terminal domain-containing protein [Propionibacteriaceae bacterium]
MASPVTPASLTLLEKAALVTGKSVWETHDLPRHGLRSLWLADGPHGLRRQVGSADNLGLNPSHPATCFPTAAGLANSWDPDLAEEVGAALGAEARAQGVDAVLGPGLNIKRSPLGGRNFEYFSEDPLLSGKMAAGSVRGIQSTGTAACPKHFAANSQELRRMASDSVVDEATLRELYLAGFEIAVREGRPRLIMSSYNLINGVHASEDPWLLKSVLRDEWGFDGAVVTDWGGSNDIVAAIAAGGTLEMPAAGHASTRAVVAAVEAGRLSPDDLDARVGELIALVTAAADPGTAPDVDPDAHHALARRAAALTIVLLKNEDLLPLAQGTRVAVVGDFAAKPRYQGAGSSVVNPTRLDTVVDLIGESGLEMTRFEPGFRRDGAPDAALRERAVAAARDADVVLLFLGLDEAAESEGVDRRDLWLPTNQVELLQAVAAANPRVAVVLSLGGVVEVPWLGSCQALLHAYLGGQAGAGGVLDVLTGKVNPSARLAETMPVSLADTPTAGRFPVAERVVEYTEGMAVGYRHYTAKAAPVAFPFGFGLSYTRFEYSNLEAASAGLTVTVANTGGRDGAEVVQVYVRPVGEKMLELKGFARVEVPAGGTVDVTVPLGDAAFRHWDAQRGAWHVAAGDYEVLVAASVADVRCKALVGVEGVERGGGDGPVASGSTSAAAGSGSVSAATGSGSVSGVAGLGSVSAAAGVGPASAATGLGSVSGAGGVGSVSAAAGPGSVSGAAGVESVSDAAGVGSASAAVGLGSASDAARPGRVAGGEVPLGSAALTADSVVGDMVSAPSRLARFVARLLQSRMARAEARGEPDLNLLFVWNMPFARLAKVTGGMVDGATVAGVVRIVNGHFCGGLRDAARGFFANRKANRATARALAEASR